MPQAINLLSLYDIGFDEEIAETAATIEGNALLKAKAVANATGQHCFADDSGLLVDALNGAPGVHSARYAGEHKSDNDNIDKLLLALESQNKRQAHFKTVMALIMHNKEYLFEGIVHGTIINERRGDNGFGYDPVFVPDGFSKTFAEMSLDEKNAISHRKMALKKLLDFLKSA